MINKDNIKIFLVILIVGLGLGYAYINSDLNINGTAQVRSANWDVHWANVQVSSGSVSASSPTISNQTTVNYTVTLNQPGDYYEFTVDAVNGGSIDAMIDTTISKLNGVEITNLPAYLKYTVTYADGGELLPNHRLLHNTTEKYKVKIKYKEDIDSSQLPTTNQALNLQFTVTYRQANENAVPKTFTGTIYAYYYDQVTVGDTIPTTNTYWIMHVSTDSEPLKTHPYYSTYETESECTALIGQIMDNVTLKRARYCTPSQSLDSEDLGSKYYLKYELTNGVVTGIYNCFVSDKEYCLTGGDSSVYQANVNILNSTAVRTWFESKGGNCRQVSNSYWTCYTNDPTRISIITYTDGSIQAWGENSWLCQVWFDTSSNKTSSFCMQD